MEELGQASSTELKYVEDRIGALAGIQGATVEKTLILKAELDRVKELIDVCESVDDFIAVKQLLDKLFTRLSLRDTSRCARSSRCSCCLCCRKNTDKVVCLSV